MNLPQNVNQKNLKIQYHKLAKIYHPDMQREERLVKKMEVRFRQLQQANQVLKVKFFK